MLPLRDDIPSKFTPYMTRAIIVANTLFFLYKLPLAREEVIRLFYMFGVVPARYFDPQWARYVGFPELSFLPFFSHMFLHSGFFHFLINMWILWVFADNVEDVMGPFKFLIFYLLCGLLALGGHMLLYSQSTIPVIGASGAIAGVMGAYLILYPQARVLTLVPIFIFPLFLSLPALIFLGLWFVIQIMSGLMASLGSASDAAGVAWWAHAFGFLAGLLLLNFFKDDKRCYYCFDYKKDSLDEFLFK
ncbi:MAG: rhomboid family intramembrane serine protease [Desulfohalobiaceae bacterium]